MSEQDTGQDRTEEPTEERLKKAREEGQLARSKDLQSAALVLGGGLLLLSASHLGEFARTLMHLTFDLDRHEMTEPGMMLMQIRQATELGLYAFLPIVGFLWLLGFISGMIPGGMNYTFKAIAPQLKRISLFSGLKRMFSKDTLTELFKSILKVILMLGISGMVLWGSADTILAMNTMSLFEALNKTIAILSMVFLCLGLGLLVIAAIDVPFQMWSTRNKMKMTQQEIKDEHKNNEGSPQLKQKIREMQIKISKRKIDRQVPEADVIIVNPTHYSVAIKYDPTVQSAPFVVAKGTDEMAFRIREVAAEHNKPIIEAPDLARAVYYSTREYQVIPVGLYVAVSTLLKYVMELNALKARGRSVNAKPVPEFKIPEYLRK